MMKKMSIYISINIFLFNITFSMDYKPADTNVLEDKKILLEDNRVVSLEDENQELKEKIEDLQDKLDFINKNKEFQDSLFAQAEKENLSLSTVSDDIKKANRDLQEDNRILRESLSKYHLLSQLSLSSLVVLSVIYLYKYFKTPKKRLNRLSLK